MKRRYEIALWVVGSWVALSIVFGLLALVYFQKFYPDAPKADYPPAQDLATVKSLQTIRDSLSSTCA